MKLQNSPFSLFPFQLLGMKTLIRYCFESTGFCEILKRVCWVCGCCCCRSPTLEFEDFLALPLVASFSGAPLP